MRSCEPDHLNCFGSTLNAASTSDVCTNARFECVMIANRRWTANRPASLHQPPAPGRAAEGREKDARSRSSCAIPMLSERGTADRSPFQ